MPAFRITYWGVTGTLAAPLSPVQVTDKIARAVATLIESGRVQGLSRGAALLESVRQEVERLPFHQRSTYGGNTTCVEVQTPDALFILDCGSGFRQLGMALERRWNAPNYDGPREAHILISHPHFDHTHATPFTDACFDPRNRFTLWAPRIVLESIRAVLDPASPLSKIYFPPTIGLMKAMRDLCEIQPGASFQIASTEIHTQPLRHPGGCLGYRLENAGRAYVFATDHEQIEAPDRELAAFAAAADVLYLDGQYLQEEYEGRARVPGEVEERPHRGWGHSSVESCVATAVAANVRELHIGHREPRRSDEDVARLEAYAQKLLADALRRVDRPPSACRVCVPYEGFSLSV
jgi:phosphoribosyl 1,2-cyclic phosphodiesterase